MLHKNTTYKTHRIQWKSAQSDKRSCKFYIKKKKKERIRISNIIFHLKEQ